MKISDKLIFQNDISSENESGSVVHALAKHLRIFFEKWQIMLKLYRIQASSFTSIKILFYIYLNIRESPSQGPLENFWSLEIFLATKSVDRCFMPSFMHKMLMACANGIIT